MKYRDLITIFIAIIFILSLAYVIAVDSSLWYVSVIVFVIFIYFSYKLWFEK
jgi:integral membrane sensor domain MASE1